MTLGQVLKGKRLQLGKSLEQISTATRIHYKVLNALEEDRYADLPARAFTRGFIIAYCKSLQLNSDEIMRDYHDFLESKFAERPEKDHGHQGYVFERKETEQNRRWLILSASGAAIFAVLTLLFFKPQNHKRKEKHKEYVSEEAEAVSTENPELAKEAAPTLTATGETTASTVSSSTSTVTASSVIPSPTPAPTATASATPTPTPTASPAASPSPTPKQDLLNKGDDMLPQDVGVKISIQADEDTLIHYHSDQRTPYSIMLRKGKSLVIKAKDVIRVQTDHPEQLKYKVNSKTKNNSTYSPLEQNKLEIKPDGSLTSFDGNRP